MTSPKTIRDSNMDANLLKIVNHVSRQKIGMCWHCSACSGGCPFVSHMDILPNRVIRLVQLGQRKEVLGCRTIWLCVGCHTCSCECPNLVDIAAVMDVLRQLAIHDGIRVPEKDIYRFHKHIYRSIRQHGRLHKLEALMRFKLNPGHLFTDLPIGLKMFSKGKLELMPTNVEDRGELDRIFSYYDKRRRSFESNE